MSWTIQNFDDNGFKIPVVPFSINGGGASQQQYLVQLSASAGSHYRTNIELKAGYRVELVAQIDDTGSFQTYTDSNGDRFYFEVTNTGLLTWNSLLTGQVMLDNQVITRNSPTPQDSKLHTVSMECLADSTINTVGSNFLFSGGVDQIIEQLRVYDETDQLTVHLDFKQPPGTQFIPNQVGSDFAEAVNIPTENYIYVTWDASRNAWVGVDDPSIIIEVA